MDFGSKWPWGVQIGYSPDATFTNSLELALNLLATNEEATIVSKPQVLAQDGKEATLLLLHHPGDAQAQANEGKGWQKGYAPTRYVIVQGRNLPRPEVARKSSPSTINSPRENTF